MQLKRTLIFSKIALRQEDPLVTGSNQLKVAVLVPDDELECCGLLKNSWFEKTLFHPGQVLSPLVTTTVDQNLINSLVFAHFSLGIPIFRLELNKKKEMTQPIIGRDTNWGDQHLSSDGLTLEPTASP